jgi:SulP family sulfate permease
MTVTDPTPSPELDAAPPAVPKNGGMFSPATVRLDLLAGLTAGVVALPLALAFGEASGAGPIAGLWGAIIVGFFAAMFGGTATQVSGPTGPMIVVFAGVFSSLSGDLSLIFTSVVAAGALQILFGVLRLGRYISLVPYPVVSGFMSGIGVIIILLQASRLFGGEPDEGGTLGAIFAIPGAVASPNMSAVVLSVVTLLIVFLWPKAWARFVPGALAALTVGTVLGYFILPDAPNLGDIPTGLPEFVMPGITSDTAFVILEAAVILAILGSIDSLLTSLVADNMTRTRHKSNQELIGQGVGNTIAGLFGAIPGAGATMRTVVNIRSGGVTRLSGVVHSVFLLAVALVLGPVAAVIPHAVLAGILVKVGYDILDIQFLKRSSAGPRADLAVFAVVLGVTVFVDLITAVAVGVVLAALAFVKQLADRQLENFHVTDSIDDPADTELLDRADGRITVFELDGPLSFGAAADLAHRAQADMVDKTEFMVLDFTRAPFLDSSATRAIESLIGYADEANITVFASGIDGEANRALEVVSGIDQRFDSRTEALAEAVRMMEQTKRPATQAPQV